MRRLFAAVGVLSLALPNARGDDPKPAAVLAVGDPAPALTVTHAANVEVARFAVNQSPTAAFAGRYLVLQP